MDTIVPVDGSDPRARRPTFESANQPQFHEITIAIDNLAPVSCPRFAAHLSSRVGSFAQDYAVVERHGPWAVPKQAGFRAKAESTERQG